VDVAEPNSDGYHVYQIKGFTGSMTSSRRRQVEQSLQRILDDPRLDRPVTGWSLVVPIDPTAEDEAWFGQLTAQAPLPCDWKGKLFWDSEAAKHAHVIDYYLRDGKARLEARCGTYSTCSISPARRSGLPMLLGSSKTSVPRSTVTIPTTDTSFRPPRPPRSSGRSQTWS
jgi:hypothetical protein